MPERLSVSTLPAASYVRARVPVEELTELSRFEVAGKTRVSAFGLTQDREDLLIGAYSRNQPGCSSRAGQAVNRPNRSSSAINRDRRALPMGMPASGQKAVTASAP